MSKFSGKFTGIITALVTPFKNHEIDYDSLKKLIKFQLDEGIEGFVVHGTTGESPTVTERERKKIFEFIKSEVGGQVPLIAGTGSNSTDTTIELSKEAEDWGADALLLVVPYYNKPPQRGLYQHFKWIAERVTSPIFLYNVPGRTITGLELETIFDLSKIDNIVGIKEATGDVSFGKKIIDKCDKDFIVLSGDDATCMELSAVGGQGVISVCSHVIARPMKEIHNKIKKGNLAERHNYNKYLNFIKSLYTEANPIPVKYAMKKMGIISSEEMRLPLVALSETLRPELDARLKELGLLK